VLNVDVALPAEVLKTGLELLDTPGVGGLRPAHQAAALKAVAQADALVFVVKPGEPLSKTEMSFLAKVAGRVGACVLVQTHDDLVHDGEFALQQNREALANPDKWEAVLGDPQQARNLAEHFASMPAVSVSATNALDAALSVNEEGNTLWEESKLPMLREILLQDIVANGRKLHQRNICALIEDVHREIRGKAQDRLSIYEGGDPAAAVIDALSARVEMFETISSGSWRTQFDTDCTQLAKILEESAQNRANELDREYRDEFKRMKRAEIGDVTERLADSPGALLLDLIDVIERFMNEAIARIHNLLEAEGLAGAYIRADRANVVLSRLPRHTTAIDEYRSELGNAGHAVAGGLAVAGIVHMMQDIGFIEADSPVPLLWPFLLGAGVGAWVAQLRRRRDRSVESATLILDAAVKEIRTTVYKRACEILDKMREEIVRNVGDAQHQLENQISEDKQIRSKALKMTPEEHEERITDTKADLKKVDELHDRLATFAFL
jgi:hypothetical protein